MDSRSAATIAPCHPDVITFFTAAHDKLMALPHPVEMRAIQGLRTAAEQDALYALGRTVLTTAGKPQPIVTNAKHGWSSHNFGLAIDVVPGVLSAPQWTPQWNVKAAEYVLMVQALKEAGFKWGGDWRTMKGDYDHFYLPNSPANPTDRMRNDLAIGLQTVYLAYDHGDYTPISGQE